MRPHLPAGWQREVDWVLLGACFTLSVIGIVCIESVKGQEGGLSSAALKQTLYLAVAVLGVAASLFVDYRKLSKYAPWIYGGCLLLLLALIPFGREVSGEKSRLTIPGLGLSLQPSEFMKLGVVILLASAVARRPPGRVGLSDWLMQGVIVFVPVGLILVEPDQGTALTFIPLLAVTLFGAGLRWRFIVVGVLAAALFVPAVWPVLRPHHKNRIKVWLQPELDPSGVGYHPIQSRIAVGSGGLTGQGYRQGPQNRLGFLPERHTDFIFAIVAEEWGFLGAVSVLGLYLLVLKRIVETATLARDRLGAFICAGAMSFISVQLIVNVGMVLGLLPTIGVTLPLLSYGGSSLLATSGFLALIVNVRLRRYER